MDPEELLKQIQAALDDGLLIQLYRVASVSPEDVLTRLRRSGLAVHSLEEVVTVSTELLDSVADEVLAETQRSGALSGASFGLGGFLTLAPELVWSTAQLLRLAQRLSLVYGLEVQSPSGSLQLWQSIARSLEIRVHLEGPEGNLVRNLPALIGRGPYRDPLLVRVVQQVLLSLAVRTSFRFTRLVPLASAGLNGISTWFWLRKTGRRLQAELRERHQLLRIHLAEPGISQEVAFVMVERHH